MTTLTIRLDPKLARALKRVAKSTGRTTSEIAREALRRQVAVARFRELRRKTLTFAEAQGLVTDEDVFLENLARPHVVNDDLVSGYQAMAADTKREQEALEWSNALVGDVAERAQ